MQAMKYTRLIPLLLIMVAGSLIAGIFYIGFNERRFLQAEDFLLRQRHGPLDGFKESIGSTKVYAGHRLLLVDAAVDLQLSFPFISGQSRIFLLWGERDSSVPVPVLKEELIGEFGSFRSYLDSDSADIRDDWVEYADYCGYASLSYWNEGKGDEARVYYQKFHDMWNGTGFVDKDAVTEERFMVYKNAMFLFLTKKLHQSCSFIHEVEAAIWATWDPERGGFYPYYTSNRVFGDVHLESTSWVLIAYNRGKHLLDS